jgi:hypothetical protein
MLQRIQTVFLLIAILAIGLTFVLPVAYLGNSQDSLTTYTNFGVSEFSKQGYVLVKPGYNYIPAITALLILLFAIFQYKRRKFQVILCRVAAFLSIVLTLLDFLMPRWAVEGVKVSQYGYGCYLPIVALVFILLAEFFILRDEKLVKSADRLR